ncbi:MAG: hypothetical protein DRQ10_00740 [Candidatus Hydrothermota bacterium]|nr:MAG: hypothetical protein DRQ10_00740 [Candidatus Hydrothermae bacterium]
MNKDYSPFTPGNPVPVELFVGRKEQIEEMLRYAVQAANGRMENVFLIGDRGIGKSSFASFLRHLLEEKYGFLPVHVFLGRIDTLTGMVRLIFDEILKVSRREKWFDRVKSLFGKYIKEVGFFGISVSFSPPESELQELVRNFPYALANLLKEIRKEKAGLFIVLDDINGLSQKPEFANWYKSFVDEISVRYKEFHLLNMLIGLPEIRDQMSRMQPSLMRIFRILHIERLKDAEVEEFFRKAFGRVEFKVEESALKLMVRYSSGLPLLMHEIGDATFWLDKDGVIDFDDAWHGILKAAENVGQKYLDPKVYRAIRSQRYRSILRKLGSDPEIPLTCKFKKRDIEKKLNETEKKVFHNFLKRMRTLGVIEPDIEEGRGAYRFTNAIYPIYIWLESLERKKKNL